MINEVVKKLKENSKTISTMESCTGGDLVNFITNVEGSSEILKFSAVTYSNEYKIKMGVSKEVIDKYSVYSEQTAKEMSKNISIFANSNYGVGITGKLICKDDANPFGDDDKVFISIYDKDNDLYYTKEIIVYKNKREENKELVVSAIVEFLYKILYNKL